VRPPVVAREVGGMSDTRVGAENFTGPNERPRSRYTARELVETEFPEPRFAIPALIPEGLTFFAGAPKLGKSWLALGLSIAVASGGRALGQIEVEQGEVQYLALEDSPRRLKGRLASLLNGSGPPDGLTFETRWLPLADGGAEEIAGYLSNHPRCRLLVCDVFARLRSPAKDSGDRYMHDYLAAEQLQKVATEYGVAIIAVHHTRKAAADDFLETVSGTHGLAAAADTIAVLKRSRGQGDAEFHVTGRDISEQSLALKFAPSVGTWSLLGDAREWAMSESRRKILDALKAGGPMGPKQIHEETGVDYDVVRQLVRKMVDEGDVDTPSRGIYAVHNVHSVHSPQLEVVNTVNEVNGLEGPSSDA
jgi:hypothetical protein